MKRIFVMLLFVILLVACSLPTNETGSESKNETDEEKGIEVDKGLLNVEITLPSSLFEEDELAAIEENVKVNYDANVTQNENKSITVKMSKTKHNELMTAMKDEFIASFNEIVEDEELPSVKNIEHNNDLTEIKIIVEKEAFENSFDGIATLTLGLSSLYYQAFNGKNLEKDKVIILVEDEATNEVFNEIVYPDVLEEMGEEE